MLVGQEFVRGQRVDRCRGPFKQSLSEREPAFVAEIDAPENSDRVDQAEHHGAAIVGPAVVEGIRRHPAVHERAVVLVNEALFDLLAHGGRDALTEV